MKKIRILFLDTKPIRRGAQVFVDDLKRKFEQDGISVKRLFLYEEHQFQKLDLTETDVVLPFGENHFFEKIPSVHPGLVSRIRKAVLNFDPDIVLCNGSRTLKYAAAVKLFLGNHKSKWVYRVIDSSSYWNPDSLKRLYYKHFIIPALDAAVGVSETSRKDMVNNYHFKKPSTTIHRGISMDKFSAPISAEDTLEFRKKIGIPANAFVLLFLGNLTPQKRPDRFLNILAELKKKHDNIYGLIVGDGILMPDVVKQAEAQNIGSNIVFAGYVKNVLPHLNASNVLLLTSDTEGLPGVVLEAGFNGLPAIAAQVGGVSECILNGVTGFICDKNNEADFVAKTEWLMLNQDKYAAMSYAAKNNISEKFSMDVLSKKYLDFFQWIINNAD